MFIDCRFSLMPYSQPSIWVEKNRIGGCSRGVVYSGAGEEETQWSFSFLVKKYN